MMAPADAAAGGGFKACLVSSRLGGRGRERERERFLFSLGAASRVWRVDRHGTLFFLNPAHYGFPLSREAETAEVTTE